MTEHVRQQGWAGRRGWRLGIAVLAAAVLPLAAVTPADAVTGHRVAGIAEDLESLGLEVVENDGLVGATGDADPINEAIDRFADLGVVAMFTGPDETGTGYLMIRDANQEDFAELQAGPGDDDP